MTSKEGNELLVPVAPPTSQTGQEHKASVWVTRLTAESVTPRTRRLAACRSPPYPLYFVYWPFLRSLLFFYSSIIIL